MPGTGRQRRIVKATWGATDLEPSSYTLETLSPEGIARPAVAASAIDLSDVGMICVVFPATIAVGAITLQFKDAPTLDGTYVTAQDENGSDIAVTGVQSSTSKSRSIDLSLCSRFFVKPYFVDAGGSVITPAACTVTFLLKE